LHISYHDDNNRNIGILFTSLFFVAIVLIEVLAGFLLATLLRLNRMFLNGWSIRGKQRCRGFTCCLFCIEVEPRLRGGSRWRGF